LISFVPKNAEDSSFFSRLTKDNLSRGWS
jgi:hypothetical protein